MIPEAVLKGIKPEDKALLILPAWLVSDPDAWKQRYFMASC